VRNAFVRAALLTFDAAAVNMKKSLLLTYMFPALILATACDFTDPSQVFAKLWIRTTPDQGNSVEYRIPLTDNPIPAGTIDDAGGKMSLIQRFIIY
jgi:hypothetical protein